LTELKATLGLHRRHRLYWRIILVQISWQWKDVMMRFATVCCIVLFFFYQDANGKFVMPFNDLQLKQRFSLSDKIF